MASRHARARRASRCLQAFVTAVATFAAKSMRISSSSPVNAAPSSLSLRKEWPMCPPRSFSETPHIVLDLVGLDRPSERR